MFEKLKEKLSAKKERRRLRRELQEMQQLNVYEDKDRAVIRLITQQLIDDMVGDDGGMNQEMLRKLKVRKDMKMKLSHDEVKYLLFSLIRSAIAQRKRYAQNIARSIEGGKLYDQYFQRIESVNTLLASAYIEMDKMQTAKDDLAKLEAIYNVVSAASFDDSIVIADKDIVRELKKYPDNLNMDFNQEEDGYIQSKGYRTYKYTASDGHETYYKLDEEFDAVTKTGDAIDAIVMEAAEDESINTLDVETGALQIDSSEDDSVLEGASETIQPTGSSDRQIGEWQTTGAVVTGALHRRAGNEGEDSLALHEKYKVACIADGKSGDKHPYAKEGAEIATDVILRILSNFLDSESSAVNIEDVLPKQIETKWKDAIRKWHDEQKRSRTTSVNSLYNLYATTALAIAITPKEAIIIRIGDGDILMINDDGVTPILEMKDSPSSLDKTLNARDAWRHVKVRTIAIEEKPSMFLISTDGYSHSFPEREVFIQECSHIYRSWLKEGFDYVDSNVEKWIQQASDNSTGEDIAIAVLARNVKPPKVRTEFITKLKGRFHNARNAAVDVAKDSMAAVKGLRDVSKDDEAK